ncbi:poly (glycerol-phosphate) alpha-glucosyltransferase [hydrocarbon metagenome]|uniref:Poly (Glycerol-phosphate) alpha-glucosyltransferase n=1 Tax=hydrocarbon metagenome TaxID=938273 RepID=A0A0W8FND0_9ZZZZ
MRKNKLIFYLCLLAFILFGAISAQAKVLDVSMKSAQSPALRIDVTQNQPHTIVLARNYLSSTIQNQPKTGTEIKKISPRKIEEALYLAGEYFKNSVKEDGSFVYEYHPPTDEESPQYNMLRHAGTIYAMVELYEFTKDKILLERIQKAITFLLGKARNIQINNHEALVVLDYDSIKLGGNALAILALAKYMDTVKTREYLEIAKKMAHWIHSTQSPDGRFLIHKQDFTTKVISDFVSGFYPGEAIYALTLLYKIDRNKEWLDTAEKAAHYLILVRDGGKSSTQLNHDHWLLYGLNELYRLSPEKLYYEHALKITDVILNAQRKDPSDDEAGSFDKPAYSTGSATRIEGLSAVYKLVRDFGTKRELEPIFNGICLGTQFLLKNQITRELAKKKNWPSKAVGGFQENTDIPNIRIDCVQHNVSALLGAYRMLKEKH